MANLVYTPENQMQLMIEIRKNHPELHYKLKQIKEFELQLAEICTYCNVVIDAACFPADMSRLFDTLYQELKAKSVIILP